MSVVVAVPRVHAEVLHRLGALLREELHVDVPDGGVERGLGGNSIDFIKEDPQKSPKNLKNITFCVTLLLHICHFFEILGPTIIINTKNCPKSILRISVLPAKKSAKILPKNSPKVHKVY